MKMKDINNPFQLSRKKDGQLLIDVYNVLRKSTTQYFRLLSYSAKYVRNNALPFEQEFIDINDLGIDLSKDEWLNIIQKIEFRFETTGVQILQGQKIKAFAKKYIKNLDKITIFRAEIKPGIHDFLYSHVTDSIAVSCYMLRMVELSPWVSPPWFKYKGITFKHGEDVAIHMKNHPDDYFNFFTSMQAARSRAILDIDSIKGKVYNLQSETPATA